jgi:hypothetical protein
VNGGLSWQALILTLIASLPGIYGIWSGRRKARAEAGKAVIEAESVARTTTREEYQVLYGEMRAQLEDARRGWSACRSECTSLRISLDLEEQKTEVLEKKVWETTQIAEALATKVEGLSKDLEHERQEREALQRIVDRRRSGGGR